MEPLPEAHDYDLIASKLMRGTPVDFDDCLALAEAHRSEMDTARLTRHFQEMIGYDVAEKRLSANMAHFLVRLREKGLYD
jgi:hypothetical protein